MLEDIEQIIVQFLKNSAERKAQGHAAKPLLVILGPTASGKTSFSIEIAKKFDGEVVSADSRQVYKFMDIGTAKVKTNETEGIPHYMIDEVDPDKEFTLADYVRKAKFYIDEILKHGKLPILVGGTGLYIRAICQNYNIPRVAPNYEIRDQLEKEILENGEDAVYKKLIKLDPEAAAKIHPHNHVYVIRAIEVAMSGMNKRDMNGESEYNILKIGIDWEREKLYSRIDERAKNQIDEGLINETKTLLQKGYSIKLPSMSSLGYPEITAYIKGEISLTCALEMIQQNTRNYAKRQLTWFRREPDVLWVPGEKLTEQITE
ncbi:tRNA (adenosine(37)-N6)-dimethylallyltransferase MiaA [Candidatus Peregrinibacteria bacterium]|nr:tRNA (adenosine(37)-N6)-dimethylallyltransferase MiaA [Candidatus Peregrinibacteria bacterium]